MCGIYGEVGVRGDVRVGQTLDRATDSLAHRGPDERGVYRGDGVALGMRRLAILDLEAGQQPMWNAARDRALVYNGELYNFRDLRAVLESRGRRFRTRGDTEVVLEALCEWGIDALTRMNGMFALALWDARDRSLLLARDRVGEKPLYFTDQGGRFRFASEIKALLVDPSFERRLSPRGLENYLAFGHSLAPRTILEGVKKLRPGHYLQYRDGDWNERGWWDVGDEPQLVAGEALDFAAATLKVRSLIDDAVRLRMVADVPVGAFLSGGVDSSAIVALMQRHRSSPVKTFSLGFTVGGGYDERGDARQVARVIGTDHHELAVESLDLVETLKTLVYHYDEPFADPAGFPVYLLSKFAHDHVKVVLTGDGGDELFGGYRRHVYDQLAGPWSWLPRIVSERWLPAMAARLPRFRRVKRTLKTLPIRDPARRCASWLEVFSRPLREELRLGALANRVGDHDPAADYPRYYHRREGALAADHLNRLLYVDLKTWLPDAFLEKTDKASMAASIEARLPLLDHRLVELAFALPGRFKIRGTSTKRIWKAAVADLVPEFVLKKPKRGFAVPTDPWFRGELKDFAFAVLLDGPAKDRELFDLEVIERMWRDHAAGREVYDLQLFVLLNLELWLRQTFD